MGKKNPTTNMDTVEEDLHDAGAEPRQKKTHHIVENIRDVAILVGVDTGKSAAKLSASESLEELARLCETLGVTVADKLIQKRERIHPGTYIGKGKLEELVDMVNTHEANTVICDDEITQRQQGNLEKALGEEIVVMDRTALILDIFALHATTREGKLQVELATLQYELPRLRGKWTHLEKEKLGGGVGFRFGMGESQLEADRRLARRRIGELSDMLKKVEAERKVQRGRRERSGIYRVALAGYTNAGKSTLLNALTHSDVLVYDKLFATLDATTREMELPSKRKVTVTDTVGFISKLPHELVQAFKSTLEEVCEADLLLDICDGSSDQIAEQIESVAQVLEEIDAQTNDNLLVINKSDLIDPGRREELTAAYPEAVFVSALTGDGLLKLKERIEEICVASQPPVRVLIPFDRGDLVQLAYDAASVSEESFTEEGTLMIVQAKQPVISRLEEFIVT
ncbi:MAG: GTPase HflX [Actinomycetia bacterium]|nr:GTPase HflX [Actinomycetes bacterium]